MKTLTDNLRLADSLAALTGPSGSVDDIRDWVKKRNGSVTVDVDLVDLSALKQWKFHPGTGDLEHESGRFFAIRGISVETEGYFPDDKCWTQPIIDQPEVGFLGIIVQEHNGVLCFLLQAKIEPGNLNHVQLSPTLQATRSNYMRIHGGRKPLFLEYFHDAGKYKVWLDQLQSEQGGRFLHKRNRNIIIEVTEPIPEHDDFIWVTLGQLKTLMTYDNVVNMDTRTVISGLGWHAGNTDSLSARVFSRRGSALLASMTHGLDTGSINEILFWLSDLKSRYLLHTKVIPLRDVNEWEIRKDEIVRHDRKFFRVVGAQVTIGNREVTTWSQPLVQPMQKGLCGLLVKQIGGVMYFLIQAKMECGNLDVVELAPTIQCLTGSYTSGSPFALSEFLNAAPEQIVYDTWQSEEGGRFYLEQNRNLVVEARDDFPEKDLPGNFKWMTLGQLREFLRFNNYLNIQLRSLLAALNLFAV